MQRKIVADDDNDDVNVGAIDNNGGADDITEPLPNQSDVDILPNGRTINVSAVLTLCQENELVGYPSKRPSLSSLDHGWFYGSHREVIDAIVHERTGAVLLIRCQ